MEEKEAILPEEEQRREEEGTGVALNEASVPEEEEREIGALVTEAAAEAEDAPPPDGPERDGEEAEADERMAFVMADVDRFIREYPGVDLRAVLDDGDFLRFCGSRYGREPTAALYRDYCAVVRSAERAAVIRAESRAKRSTGSGGSGKWSGLTVSEKKLLDEWNAAYPNMRMTAAEFLRREDRDK